MIETITVLHNDQCTFWQKTKADLETLLGEKQISVPIGEVLIGNDEAAKEHKFFGSPQVEINGQDIDPMAKMVTAYHASGCRPYFWQDNFQDFPPREMLKEALDEALKGGLR